jgi:hypothetical protein
MQCGAVWCDERTSAEVLKIGCIGVPKHHAVCEITVADGNPSCSSGFELARSFTYSFQRFSIIANGIKWKEDLIIGMYAKEEFEWCG